MQGATREGCEWQAWERQASQGRHQRFDSNVLVGACMHTCLRGCTYWKTYSLQKVRVGELLHKWEEALAKRLWHIAKAVSKKHLTLDILLHQMMNSRMIQRRDQPGAATCWMLLLSCMAFCGDLLICCVRNLTLMAHLSQCKELASKPFPHFQSMWWAKKWASCQSSVDCGS